MVFDLEGEALGLIVTNAVLGVAILALLVAVAWSVVREILSPKKRRRA